MIICIYGKSGAGKTYLADKLENDLPNSIHLDLDTLNRDLMATDGVINDAKKIFGELDIMSGNKINTASILHAIMSNSDLYTEWTNYMIDTCNNFLEKYISKTTFDYYILDHINAPKLNVCKQDTMFIECVLDKNTRLARLTERENITEDILNFRDNKYIEYTADITYDNTNYQEILENIINR